MEYKFTEHITFLQKIAKKSELSHKHAAALIKDSTLYSYNFNAYVQPFYKKTDQINNYFKSIHAEINVFYNFPKKYVKNLDIIVIRINNKNILKNSRPCNDCILKLRKLGIRKIYYSNDSGEIISEFVNNMDLIHVSKASKLLKNKN